MRHKKIALVGYRLNKGGAEKMMATLSNFLYKNGYDVHVIIVVDELGYSYSGELLNLGKLKNKTNGLFNKFKRLYVLKKYLKNHQFDFIIDFRFRVKPIQELLISKLVYKTKTIYTIHSSKIDEYLPNFSPLARLIYGNSFALVSITKAMQKMIKEKHHFNNVTTIYNSTDISYITEKAKDEISLNFNYIIGVGEYNSNIKQFDKLIKCYSETSLPQKNIDLVILGTGKLKNKLLSIAKENNVENQVHLLGFKANPYKYIKRAKYFVLTSKFEGLPMVLIESLACGTPVISFDCSTGPSEIISNKNNGLLVENQNIEKFKEAMELLVKDEQLYLKCKEGALDSINKFSIDNIGKQWLELLNKN